jgi:hypothetical protein
VSSRIVEVVAAPIFIFDKLTCMSFRQFSKSRVMNSMETDVVSSIAAVAKAGATTTAAPAAVYIQDVMPNGTTVAQGTTVASKTDAATTCAEIVVQDATTLVPDVSPTAYNAHAKLIYAPSKDAA